MKSLAILLALAFLTGFQAAVLSEEPPPTNSDQDQSMLEHWQDQLRKISTQVTDSLNDALSTVKGHASDVATYTTDWAKKSGVNKLLARKFSQHMKDMNHYTNSLWNQGRDMVKTHYKTAVEKLEEIKQSPTLTALNEEVVQPAVSKGNKFVSWLSDQSAYGLYSSLQKKFSS